MAFPTSPAVGQLHANDTHVKWHFINGKWTKYNNGNLYLSSTINIRQTSRSLPLTTWPKIQLPVSIEPGGTTNIYISMYFDRTINVNVGSFVEFEFKFYDESNVLRSTFITGEALYGYLETPDFPGLDFLDIIHNGGNDTWKYVQGSVRGDINQVQSGDWINSTWRYTLMSTTYSD